MNSPKYSAAQNTYNNVANANSETRTMATQIAQSLQSGATMDEILNDLYEMDQNGIAATKKINTTLLRNFANSVPIDNWQYLRR